MQDTEGALVGKYCIARQEWQARHRPQRSPKYRWKKQSFVTVTACHTVLFVIEVRQPRP